MMWTGPDSRDNSLDRQRNPEPPAQPVAPAPSLWLYVVLSLAAIILLTIALVGGGEDWTSLCMNLGSNIIGAIVILIIVEHRLRQDELQAFRRFPLRTRLSIMTALSPDVRRSLGYVRVLMAQMDEISKPYLESKQSIENAIAEKLPNGVALIGGTGTGKTTFIHRIVRKQIHEAMREPRKVRIPILVSGPKWLDGSAESVLLETMRSFYPIPEKIFYRLLRRGRLLCIFDSVDEALLPSERLQSIAKFQQEYPGNAVVLSTRPLSDAMLSILNSLKLERIEIPPLSADERARLQELKARQSQVR
jgi:hypothetical protein